MELLSYSMVDKLFLKTDKKQSLSYLLSGVPNLKVSSIIDRV
jgi:hypothetical protein